MSIPAVTVAGTSTSAKRSARRIGPFTPPYARSERVPDPGRSDAAGRVTVDGAARFLLPVGAFHRGSVVVLDGSAGLGAALRDPVALDPATVFEGSLAELDAVIEAARAAQWTFVLATLSVTCAPLAVAVLRCFALG